MVDWVAGLAAEAGVVVGLEAVDELGVALRTLLEDEADDVFFEAAEVWDEDADAVPALRRGALCDACEDGLELLIWD